MLVLRAPCCPRILVGIVRPLRFVETKFSSRGAKRDTRRVKSPAMRRYDGSRCVSCGADKCRVERRCMEAFEGE